MKKVIMICLILLFLTSCTNITIDGVVVPKECGLEISNINNTQKFTLTDDCNIKFIVPNKNV